MNKQIVGCLVAVMMSAGVGCASQGAEEPTAETTALVTEALQSGESSTSTSAGMVLCYPKKFCDTGDLACCEYYDDLGRPAYVRCYDSTGVEVPQW